jgi:hypothetical protein
VSESTKAAYPWFQGCLAEKETAYRTKGDDMSDWSQEGEQQEGGMGGGTEDTPGGGMEDTPGGGMEDTPGGMEEPAAPEGMPGGTEDTPGGGMEGTPGAGTDDEQ